AAMDLQNFSGGRFRLGLGTQVKGHIERRFSTEWGSPGPRLREYVRSLHAIWDNWQDGKKLDYHGEFYNFSLMTPFFSPGASPAGAPPVFISALNPYNCRVAGEVCQGLALHPITSAKYLTEVIKPNLAKGAKNAGRNPDEIILTGSGFVISGPDQQTIESRKEAVKRQIAFYFSTRTYFPVLEVHGFQEVGPKLHELSLKGEWTQMAGLISDDARLYDYFYQNVRAGIINWNQQLTGASGAAPFGGVGHSGNHRPGGYFTSDFCSYPVASIEIPKLESAENLPPGLC
ncbi:MAG: TIGR03617 family F420-dependent LLM class oxidoreductase, partial [SAR324 cluster bacterium]|nr:TIGR03617 family F420-dependent LLM class oxidoreductase [SAR324 cluster bacterium]